MMCLDWVAFLWQLLDLLVDIVSCQAHAHQHLLFLIEYGDLICRCLFLVGDSRLALEIDLMALAITPALPIIPPTRLSMQSWASTCLFFFMGAFPGANWWGAEAPLAAEEARLRSTSAQALVQSAAAPGSRVHSNSALASLRSSPLPHPAFIKTNANRY